MGSLGMLTFFTNVIRNYKDIWLKLQYISRPSNKNWTSLTFSVSENISRRVAACEFVKGIHGRVVLKSAIEMKFIILLLWPMGEHLSPVLKYVRLQQFCLFKSVWSLVNESPCTESGVAHSYRRLLWYSKHMTAEKFPCVTSWLWQH